MTNHERLAKPTLPTVITIPAEIARLKGLTISEQIALAHLATRPSCTNAALAQVLGLSNAGVESMLRRFRTNHLIATSGSGRARHVKILFRVEPLTFPGEIKSENGLEKNGVSVKPGCLAVQKRVPTILDVVLSRLDRAWVCMSYGRYADSLENCRQAREAILHDKTLPATGRETLSCMVEDDAIRYETLMSGRRTLKKMSVRARSEVIGKLFTASPEQLARLRPPGGLRLSLTGSMQLLALAPIQLDPVTQNKQHCHGQDEDLDGDDAIEV